jgi:RND family efflux transporter MFP subunit
MALRAYAAVIIATVWLVGCGDGSELNQVEEQAKVVQLSDVISVAGANEFSFPAKVVAKTTVDMSFRVSGRLQKVNLPEGQYIKKGNVIAKLDPEPFERAVRMAEVRVKQAKLELDRVKAVATKGIGSEKSVDNAQVSFDLAKIDLENAKANLKYSVLRAPFDALVAKRLIENEGFIGTGNAIARLQDLSRIHFEFDVPERVVSNYRRDQVSKASAYIDGAIDQNFDIYYVEHSTEPDPISQTYKVVYAMDKPKGFDITPGVRATVQVKGDTTILPSILGVPVNAISSSADETVYVWLYNEETKRINKQQIQVGGMAQGYVAVLSGLSEGQKVVSAGVIQMQDDMLVRPYVMQK